MIYEESNIIELIQIMLGTELAVTTMLLLSSHDDVDRICDR